MTEILLPDWLTRCAENFPTRLAIKFAQTSWSFAELERQAGHLALQLAHSGVQEGDRVALLAANGPDYIACVHALTRLGAILVPLNLRLSEDELRWQVQDVRASLLVHDEQHAVLAAHIAPVTIARATLAERALGDELILHNLPTATIALRSLIDLAATQAIIYTSGTTGQPKGVIITYGMLWWSAIGSALNLGHHPTDCWLACMPLFHIGGLSILMRSIIYGISVIVQEKFEATAVNRAICEEGVTIISVVAVMLQRMLTALDEGSRDKKRYPTALRCMLLGGGPAPLPLLEDCAQRTIPVVQTYGLTEACSQAVTLAPADALRKLGSAGRPLPPVQLRIMRHEQLEQPAAVGEPGLIYLKGPNITPGYADRPEATAQAFKDGWLSTGDIGYLDEDGYLYMLDRRNDLIISGGENVYPAQIEATLLAHPAIEEAGVCGIPDQEWGQVPIAFVRLRDGYTASAAELLAYATQHLARYKLPRAIYLVESLPRNGAGKLVRRDLLHLLPA